MDTLMYTLDIIHIYLLWIALRLFLIGVVKWDNGDIKGMMMKLMFVSTLVVTSSFGLLYLQ